MLAFARRFGLRTTLAQPFRFSTYNNMKDAISKNLYSIELINKQVSRRILAMAYSPGVGAIC